MSNNALLNVCGSKVGPNPQPGQIAVTQDQYVSIILSQLRELWGNHGPLEEVWFDGGYDSSMAKGLADLLAELQPDAVAFGGASLTRNSVRWVGTESGNAPYPCWSTADAQGLPYEGSPDGTVWMPAGWRALLCCLSTPVLPAAPRINSSRAHQRRTSRCSASTTGSTMQTPACMRPPSCAAWSRARSAATRH